MSDPVTRFQHERAAGTFFCKVLWPKEVVLPIFLAHKKRYMYDL